MGDPTRPHEDVRLIFDEEGYSVELEFEAIKRVKLGEEHCWITLVGGSEVFSGEK